MSTSVSHYEMNMSHPDYLERPGVSQSALKDLAISPLQFWYLHVNPDRPLDEPTPEMRIGHALHCNVLEGEDSFFSKYCRRISSDEVEGCLDTIEDLRNFLRERHITPKGTRKADVIAQVLAHDPSAAIWEVIEREYQSLHQNKTMFRPDDWLRIHGCAQALRNEPEMERLLSEGKPEVSLFAVDPDTGVPLKCRVDWMAPHWTVDLKTFSQQRSKPIDKCINDAIFYEAYYRQAYFYDHVRRLVTGEKPGAVDFIFAFVESEAPHEVRLRAIRPKVGTEVNMLWERARLDTRNLLRRFADYMDRYGTKPWRPANEIEAVQDADIPQLAYA